MSDPISDSSKTRPNERPSDERFPTPWTYKKRGQVQEIIDAERDAVAFFYHPGDQYIKLTAMPFIVHRVNAFDSLLEACRRVRDSLQQEAAHVGMGINLQEEIATLREAIESAEKQP